MKKLEQILIAGAITGLLLALLNVPHHSVIVSFLFMALGLLYFYLGFALFNGIHLSKIFKAESYSIQNQDEFNDELFDQVYNSINKLGRIEKAIIMLWLDNHSYDEIAEIIGITKSNVGTKLNRIKEQLKNNMNKI